MKVNRLTRDMLAYQRKLRDADPATFKDEAGARRVWRILNKQMGYVSPMPPPKPRSIEEEWNRAYYPGLYA